MTSFTIGSSGGDGSKMKKARSLPKGTRALIVQVNPFQTQFTQKIKSGPNEGQEVKKWQVKVVYEALESGKTLAYKNVDKETIPSEPFEAGERFVQYFGGVWPKDDGGIKVSEEGGTYLFCEALRENGVDYPAQLEEYEGIICAIDHSKGSGPKGPYVQAIPGEVFGRGETEEEADDHEDPEPEESSGDKNAFEALPFDDRQAIVDAQKDGVTAEDLVDAGFAEDEKHAKEILKHIPKMARRGKRGE